MRTSFADDDCRALVKASAVRVHAALAASGAAGAADADLTRPAAPYPEPSKGCDAVGTATGGTASRVVPDKPTSLQKHQDREKYSLLSWQCFSHVQASQGRDAAADVQTRRHGFLIRRVDEAYHCEA